MGDTYWTDRVIHNGGEEQTPAATEKENYQVVPVELKPAQVKRLVVHTEEDSLRSVILFLQLQTNQRTLMRMHQLSL